MANIIIPKVLRFGGKVVQVEGALERVVNVASKNPEEPKNANPFAPLKQGMVYVPSLCLYVSENRILQKNDWDKQTEALHSQNRRMSTIPEFINFVNYLRSPEGQKAVPNYQAILDEIYKLEGKWRSENLDAFFIKKEDGMYVAYHKFDNKNKIVRTEEKLESYLLENKTPGISLDEWLLNHTKQGLPKPDISQGALYSWAPVDESVARFGADSGRAYLYCSRDSTDACSSLGVRFVEPRSLKNFASLDNINNSSGSEIFCEEHAQNGGKI